MEILTLSHNAVLLLIALNVLLLVAVIVGITMLVMMIREHREDTRHALELQTVMEAEQRAIRLALIEMAKTLQMQHIVDRLAMPAELRESPPRDDSDGSHSVDLSQH